MHKSLLLTSLGFLAARTAAHASPQAQSDSPAVAAPVRGGAPPNSSVHDTAYKHFDCGTDASQAQQDFLDAIASLHQEHKAAGASGARARAAALRARQGPVAVDAYFHVVSSSAKDGQITQQMAADQVAALNTAYNPHNIRFNLLNTSFTVNDAWAVGAGDDDGAMKAALRQGSYSALNIYFQTDLAGNILGTCTLPSEIGEAPVDRVVYVADGCNVQANTMPGGSVLGYNSGMTAVHETGHWMGLLHTFEGYACDGDGDFIVDTPVQSTSTDGCPVSPAKDSCPGVPGDDPIHNYMDYSTDACYTGFTAGQVDRMQSMWAVYRNGR